MLGAVAVGVRQWNVDHERRQAEACLAVGRGGEPSGEEVRKWMLNHWRNLPLAELPARDVGHFCILREFARRPRRQNSIETLGLVAIRYPRLEAVGRQAFDCHTAFLYLPLPYFSLMFWKRISSGPGFCVCNKIPIW